MIKEIKPKAEYKGDFLEKSIENGWKIYESDAVSAYAKQAKDLMEKAETQELTEEETDLLAVSQAELSTLNKAVVLNDNMENETLYYKTWNK